MAKKPRASRARIRQRRTAANGRPGLWEGRFSVIDAYAPAGRRWLSVYVPTRAEVEAKLTDAMAARGKGLPLPRGGLTAGAYLADWINSVEGDLKPTTAARYRGLVEHHLVPRLGAHRLTALTPAHVNAMTAEMLRDGQSAHSANHARAVLRTALNDAIRQGVLVRNVAALADPRRVEDRPVNPMGPEEAHAIIDAFEGHALHALVATALWTGLRLGELLALTWDRIDLDRQQLLVAQSLSRVRGITRLSTTKTRGSARAVPIADPLRDVLAEHKLRQREVRLATEDWDDSWGDLVFSTPTGEPLKTATLSKAFSTRLEGARLRHRRFHDLRHGAATLWLAAGVDLKTVSTLLGHSTISTTANIYTSVLDTLKADAARRMTALMSSAARPRTHAP